VRERGPYAEFKKSAVDREWPIRAEVPTAWPPASGVGIDFCPRYPDLFDPRAPWRDRPMCQGRTCSYCGPKTIYWVGRAVEMAIPNQEVGLAGRSRADSPEDVGKFRVSVGRALRQVLVRGYGSAWAYCVERHGDYLYATAVLRGRFAPALVLGAVALEEGLGRIEVLPASETPWETAQYLLRFPLRAARERLADRRSEILSTHYDVNRRALWASPGFWMDPTGRRLAGMGEAIKAAKRSWLDSRGSEQRS
jgi:hypothetical protein